MDVAGVVGVVALVGATNGVIIAFFNSKIDRLESQLAALDWGSVHPKLALRKTLDKLRTEVTTDIEAHLSAINESLDACQRQAEITDFVTVTWEPFIDSLNDVLAATCSRLDWHMAMLERLGEASSDGGVTARAVPSDRRLAALPRPRLHELNLYSRNRQKRLSNAQSLASGVGDARSLARMRVMSRLDESIGREVDRLARRLDEDSRG